MLADGGRKLQGAHEHAAVAQIATTGRTGPPVAPRWPRAGRSPSTEGQSGTAVRAVAHLEVPARHHLVQPAIGHHQRRIGQLFAQAREEARRDTPAISGSAGVAGGADPCTPGAIVASTITAGCHEASGREKKSWAARPRSGGRVDSIQVVGAGVDVEEPFGRQPRRTRVPLYARRAPTTITRSASVKQGVQFAVVPRRLSKPRLQGELSGMTPRPEALVNTGVPVRRYRRDGVARSRSPARA